MLIPYEPRITGYLLAHRHHDRHGDDAVTTHWTGGRVIAVAIEMAQAVTSADFVEPELLRRFTLADRRLRVIGQSFERCALYCVPDDGRGAVEALAWRVLRGLHTVEMAVVCWLYRRGWLAVREGEYFRWRDALPFAIARWR